MFQVKKQFVSGLLKGLTVTEKTSVRFETGRIYQPCAGADAYIVVSCEII